MTEIVVGPVTWQKKRGPFKETTVSLNASSFLGDTFEPKANLPEVCHRLALCTLRTDTCPPFPLLAKDWCGCCCHCYLLQAIADYSCRGFPFGLFSRSARVVDADSRRST